MNAWQKVKASAKATAAPSAPVASSASAPISISTPTSTPPSVSTPALVSTPRSVSLESQDPARDTANEANIPSRDYSDYSRRRTELMELQRDLLDLGADNVEIDVPRITVIGGQSAGKSSLVEAVSGINVPRDSGTCTRCPMEFRMSSSAETWECRISLATQYDSHGNKLLDSEFEMEPFSPIITDVNEVEHWLRRAQAAILSPHLPRDKFTSMTLADLANFIKTDLRMLKFSKNIVRVDLRDPGATDLSFVDLPGLIQNERPDLIELIRNLAENYIKASNTVILITIPMSDDMQNQQAVRLAKEQDPAGERTIGVLTKPDTLTAGATGSRRQWVAVIQGQEHGLRHGYYCVRLPDDEERREKITRAESQGRAATFFDTTPPWSEMSDRNRFGIPAFVSYISKLLVNLMEKHLPGLEKKVDTLLDQCNDDLSRLPVPLTNEPSAEISLRIAAFCEELRSTVFADSNKSFVQASRRSYTQFKDDIRSTSPDFRPVVTNIEPSGPFELESPREQYVSPLLSDKESEAAESPPPLISSFSTRKPLDLSDVRDVIAEATGWELPGHVPFEATKVLVLECTKKWREPSTACFNKVFNNLESTIDKLVKLHFGQFGGLERHIKSLTRVELDFFAKETMQTLDKMLELESKPLFTQNGHYFDTERDKWFSQYRQGWTQSYPYRASSPRNEYRDELLVMANVRAYFQIAYKRIIDYVPLAIEHTLNQGLAKKMPQRLFGSFSNEPNPAQKMKELLEEDPFIVIKRESLKVRRTRLMKMKEKLDNFRLHSDKTESAISWYS